MSNNQENQSSNQTPVQGEQNPPSNQDSVQGGQKRSAPAHPPATQFTDRTNSMNHNEDLSGANIVTFSDSD
jgi:hypothetical protein